MKKRKEEILCNKEQSTEQSMVQSTEQYTVQATVQPTVQSVAQSNGACVYGFVHLQSLPLMFAYFLHIKLLSLQTKTSQ